VRDCKPFDLVGENFVAAIAQEADVELIEQLGVGVDGVIAPFGIKT